MSFIITSIKNSTITLGHLTNEAKDITVQKTKKISENVISLAHDVAVLKLPKGLKVADEVLDYMPIGSTASNLIGISLKHLVFKDKMSEESFFKAYIDHINSKEDKEFILYGIPVIGNLAKMSKSLIGFFKDDKKDENLEEKGQSTLAFYEEMQKIEDDNNGDYLCLVSKNIGFNAQELERDLKDYLNL